VSFHTVKIQRVIGPTPNGAAVLLGNDEKTFVIFIGFYEAAALIREINNEVTARPLTHELVQNVFLGFDIKVKNVVISAIIDNTFCSTLVLQQEVGEGKDGDDWNGKRNEVRIDARPSDCLVLALKSKVDILVSDEVFSKVQDVSQMAEDVENSLAGMMGAPSSEGELPAGLDKASMVIPDKLPIDLFPEGEELKEDLEWGDLDLTLEDDPAEGGQDDEEPDD
jgi:bifunctional DNase/RNase